MTTRDTGRADFQRDQARLLGERTKPVAPPETPKLSHTATEPPEVATDSQKSETEASA